MVKKLLEVESNIKKPNKKIIKVLKKNTNKKIIKVLKKNTNKVIKKDTNKKIIKVLKNANKEENKSNNEVVKPNEWILPNKIKFINWINKIFINYQLKGKHEVTKGFKISSSQKFIRDYMQSSSPYRGILLYHGLGSGKTCSSITVAENLKHYMDNIIVMLPASIKQNFIHELKFCGDDRYKSNSKTIDNTYTFISYNSSTKIKQLNKFNSLDNSLIIVDEIHNLVSLIVSSIINGSGQGLDIYNKIMNAQNSKIIFLSGTPVINHAYETAILFNMLKGYIEITKFHMTDINGKYLEKKVLEKINSEFEKIPEFDFIDEYYPINNNLHVCLKINSSNERYGEIINKIINIGLKNKVVIEYIEFDNTNTLFPEDKKIFDDYFIDINENNTEVFKNKDLFKRRILGLVSYLKGSNTVDYPSINKIENVKVQMSDYQYNLYEMIREYVERKQERYSKDSKKVSSVFRVYSRQILNFIFPEEVQRSYPKKILQILKTVQNNGNKSSSILKISNEELNNNANKELSEKTTKKELEKIDTLLYNLEHHSENYLEFNKLNKYSPKMYEILKNIKQCKGLILIYSQFRKMEGIGVLAKVLNVNGYSHYLNKSKSPKYAIYSGMEKDEDRINIINKFTSYDNRYGDKIKILMITAAGAEGLDLKNIRQVHILEPYWNEVKIEQVIGRAQRRRSHIDLPKNEQNIDIYRYYGVFSNSQKNQTKEYMKTTTDEFIYHIAKKKKVITDEILQIFKEVAVDCTLNSFETNNNIQCYSFGSIKNGLSSKPNIRDDYGFIKQEEEIKTTKIKLKTGLIDNNNFILIPNTKDKKFYKLINNKLQDPINIQKNKYKNFKKVVIDLNSNLIYDYYASLKHNQIKIGKIDKYGKIEKI